MTPAGTTLSRMPVNHRARPCTRCASEVDTGDRPPGMISAEYLPCETCGEPTCLDHGREFRSGFEHEDCHETIDYATPDEF